jgi:hypothetical protein
MIKIPFSSRGLIIAPVTGSRGNVVGVFWKFSLFDEFVVDVWGNKLDAEIKIFVTFSNGRRYINVTDRYWPLPKS